MVLVELEALVMDQTASLALNQWDKEGGEQKSVMRHVH